MRHHPEIRLRIQPMINLLDLRREGVDLAVRWSNGHWSDCRIERLFACPAWPTGNKDARERVREKGLEVAFVDFTLLRDRDGSEAWSEWYRRAGIIPLQRTDTLIIPAPTFGAKRSWMVRASPSMMTSSPRISPPERFTD